MKMAIVGSRCFLCADDNDAELNLQHELMYNWLDRALRFADIDIDNITQVVSGGARGIDTRAEEWSYTILNKQPLIYQANWYPNGKYDAAAGFKRNASVVREADFAVAIWDGRSHGTMDTIRRLREEQVPHIIIIPELNVFDNIDHVELQFHFIEQLRRKDGQRRKAKENKEPTIKRQKQPKRTRV